MYTHTYVLSYTVQIVNTNFHAGLNGDQFDSLTDGSKYNNNPLWLPLRGIAERRKCAHTHTHTRTHTNNLKAVPVVKLG